MTIASSLPATSVHREARPARIDYLLLALAIGSTAGWLLLNRWYSIAGHWDIDLFGFDKVRGGDGEPALSPTLRWTAAIFLGLSLIYGIGALVIARYPRLGVAGKLGVVLAGLGPGAVNVSLFPVGALDVFRYMRALKQFLYYHDNPYVTGFGGYENDPFAVHGFLLNLPNAKGPSWLLLSAAPARLAGFDDPIRMLVALKIYNLVLIGVTAWLVSLFFVDPGRRWLAGYAVWANPLMLFEGVGNVHNDAMIALLVVAALLALRRGSWLTLPLLTLSALVKYFTLQLGPLVLIAMLARRWPKRTIAFSIAASLAVAAVCVLPFWAGGEMLNGIEDVGGAYNRSSHVSIISLARQFRIDGMTQEESRGVSSHQPLFALGFVLLALPFYWRARRGAHVVQGAIDLTLIFLLLLTLLYPWYLIALIPLLVIRFRPLELAYLFVATALGLVYYPATVWAWHGSGYDRLDRHLFLSMFLTLPILAYFIVRALAAIRARRAIS